MKATAKSKVKTPMPRTFREALRLLALTRYQRS